MDHSLDIDAFTNCLQGIPTQWDGKSCIEELKLHDEHWRQSEWTGWFAQWVVKSRIESPKSHLRSPGRKFGNVEFDIGGTLDWDVKAHSTNSRQMILNDREAIQSSAEKNGAIGFVIFSLVVDFDSDGSFRAWHEDLKGAQSRYQKDRIARGAPQRRRKSFATLQDVSLVVVPRDALAGMNSSFQEGMRNSNGRPRRAKLCPNASDLLLYTQARLTF